MRGRAATLLVLAALAGCHRCTDPKTPKVKPPPRPVAFVNGEPVGAEDFERELAHARGDAGDGDAPVDLLKRRALEDLVERALLLQQAKARSITVGQDQIERAFLRLRAEYPGTHFDDLLAQERMSAAELKARLRDHLTVEKLFNDEVFPPVQVGEDEVRRYYSEHAPEFEQPERVHAVQVVVRTKEEAQKVREELRRRPQAFADVARRASIAPEGKNGGDLGYFGRGSGMPEVFDVCFRLAPGVLSEVTPSPYGFHIFKVVDRKPASRRPFEQARGEIAQKLLREKRARAQEEYLSALKARATVKIDDAALAAIAP